MVALSLCSVLARVQITLTDVTVQVNYRTPDQTQEYFLKARINRLVGSQAIPV